MLQGVWSSLHKKISAPNASHLTSQERWQVADLKHFTRHLKTSDIFSLPRTCTKHFPYIKGKINWSIWTTALPILNTRSLSLLPVIWSQGSVNFLKKYRSYRISLNRVAMIWLRVKVNRTRLCMAAHFARNEIRYQKERKQTFPVHTLCMHDSLFIIYTAL